MRVLVVGPGAMGTLFAGLLALGGHKVTVLGRRIEVVETITSRGGVVIRTHRDRAARVRAVLDPAAAGPVDLVLMAVKAYDTLQATRDALPAIDDGSVVLTLQNGLGNLEVISSLVGRERVLAGSTAHAATLLGPGMVIHAGQGDTIIGELDGRRTQRLERIIEAFGKSGVAVSPADSIESLLWGKVVVNAAINPITALLRLENGRLLEIPHARELAAAAAREAAAVAGAKGVKLSYSDPVLRTEDVCRVTAANRSSMLQDLERGRQTEIDYISGAIVREGGLLGVPTPVNWTLMQLVKSSRDGAAAK